MLPFGELTRPCLDGFDSCQASVPHDTFKVTNDLGVPKRLPSRAPRRTSRLPTRASTSCRPTQPAIIRSTRRLIRSCSQSLGGTENQYTCCGRLILPAMVPVVAFLTRTVVPLPERLRWLESTRRWSFGWRSFGEVSGSICFSWSMQPVRLRSASACCWQASFDGCPSRRVVPSNTPSQQIPRRYRPVPPTNSGDLASRQMMSWQARGPMPPRTRPDCIPRRD